MNAKKSIRAGSKYLLIIIITLLSLFHVTKNSLGQSLTWSQPQRLSTPRQKSWFPSIATDSAGRIHVAWSTEVPGYDTVMYTTSKDGQIWSDPNAIKAIKQIPGQGEATRPFLLSDSMGILHMSFRETDIYYSNAPANLARSSRNWKTDTKINEGYFSSMAEDSLLNLHLVYSKNYYSNECPICYHIYYTQSVNSGLNWSPAVDVSQKDGAAKPQILVDSNDWLHLIWESGIGGSYGGLTNDVPTDILYSSSNDGGVSWQTPIEVSSPRMNAKNAVMSIDRNGKLLVVWLDVSENTIHYRYTRDSGKHWSPILNISTIVGGWSVYETRLDSYSMAADSAGNLHLVLVGQTVIKNEDEPAPTPGEEIEQPTETPVEIENNLSVLHLTWDGSSWSEPEAIVTYEGDAPEWPRIAVGLGNQLYVVWFVREEENIFRSELGNYEIWYAHRSTSAPAIPPVVPLLNQQDLDTTNETTQIVGTDSEEISTPTPPHNFIGTAVEAEQPLNRLIYKEQDYLIIIGISLVPVSIFIIFVMALTKKFRA